MPLDKSAPTTLTSIRLNGELLEIEARTLAELVADQCALAHANAERDFATGIVEQTQRAGRSWF